MNDKDFGYQDFPENGLGIIRARTLLGNFRLWDIPNSEAALNAIMEEIGSNQKIPSIYFLLDYKHAKKVYIGETSDLFSRILSHMKNPKLEIKNWSRAFVINDARSAKQSSINDKNIRGELENFLTKLFKINNYQVTNISQQVELGDTQNLLVNNFKKELEILLIRKNKITKSLSEKNENKIPLDEVLKVLKKRTYIIEKWTAKEAKINKEVVFIRSGSSKSKGWQITFRDIFKKHLENADGAVLIPRGPILMLPFKAIRPLIIKLDAVAFERPTIDIFIRFDDKKIMVVYKNHEIEVTEYSLESYP